MTNSAPDLGPQLERWFLRRGIPHFIYEYSATEDVLTRALPLLVLVFLAEVVGVINEGWPLWANVLSILGGLALLVGGWMVSNRLRGRPWTTRPDRVGAIEIGVFVVVPALLPLVFGGNLATAALVAAANAVLLLVIYVATSYGVVPMTRWAVGRILTELGATLGLFARALPLLLLVFMFLFINAEVWAVAGGLDTLLFSLTVGLLGVMALVFVIFRVPAELRTAARFSSWSEVAAHTAASPAAGVPPRSPSADDVPPPSKGEWTNLGLVVVFSLGLQVLLVAAVVAAFFVAFGLLAISGPTIAEWTGAPAGDLATLTLGSRSFMLTGALLRVAGFLGAFAGLYFAVYAVHDPTFRGDFFEQTIAEVRESLAVRAIYRDSVVGA